eukprot:15466387-Alexandrium_andersonii.AAC.1
MSRRQSDAPRWLRQPPSAAPLGKLAASASGGAGISTAAAASATMAWSVPSGPAPGPRGASSKRPPER